MKISKRVSSMPAYPFALLNARVDALRAKGADVISLAAGVPDQGVPGAVIEAMHAAVDKPGNSAYPPYNGTAEFRRATADWVWGRFGVELSADKEVLATIGSKEAIVNIFQAYVDPGDVALLPDPGYPAYGGGVALAGGIPYHMPLVAERGYLPDFDRIPASVAGRAKLMFLNYPNNPTGAVASLDFFQRAVDFCRKHEILLCSDQAYSEITYDGYVAPSVLQVKGAKDVSIEFYSHSKPFGMAGYRVGAAVGNAGAVAALGTVKNNTDSGVFKAVQDAAVAAYGVDTSYLNKIYRERFDVAVAGFAGLGWKASPPKGGFYLWLPVPAGYTSDEFVEDVLEKAHVSVSSGSMYGAHGEGYFRVALTQDKGVIGEALRRIGDAGIKYGR